MLFRRDLLPDFLLPAVLLSNVLSSKLASAQYFIASTHFLALPNCPYSLHQWTFLHPTRSTSDFSLSVLLYTAPLFLPFPTQGRQQRRNMLRGIQNSDKNQIQHILQGFRVEVGNERASVGISRFRNSPSSNLTVVAWNCSEMDLMPETNRTGMLHFLHGFLCCYIGKKCWKGSRWWKRSCQPPAAKRHPSFSHFFSVSPSCIVDRGDDGIGNGSRDCTRDGGGRGVSLYLPLCDQMGIVCYEFNFSFDIRRSSFLLLNHGVIHFIISTV